MKETIMKFKCDECGKTYDDVTKFPYDAGWVYLYNLNMQVKAYAQTPEHLADRIEQKDSHFCSNNCFLSFVTKKLGIRPQSNDKKKAK